jgi:transposase
MSQTSPEPLPASSASASPASASPAYAGLDVGKSCHQLAIVSAGGGGGGAGEPLLQRPIPNTPEGLADLVRLCQEHRVGLVVMEATGRLELDPASALWNAGIAVSIISPAQSSAFAKALATPAKTDRLDALLLARFAQKIQPDPTAPPSALDRELRELAARRRQLTGLLVQEKTRLQQARSTMVRHSIQRVIAELQKQLNDVDDHLERQLANDPKLNEAVQLLASVPGISNTSATQLLIALPELGTLNRRSAASLAGLAPFAHDSGALTGQRHIRGGRSAARTALFMPMLSAIRYNPIVKAFYQHLLAAGKRRMVALVACMRKLLGILNSMLKQRKDWDTFILKTA